MEKKIIAVLVVVVAVVGGVVLTIFGKKKMIQSERWKVWWRGGEMKKMVMVIVSVAVIAGIAITAVCMPQNRFDWTQNSTLNEPTKLIGFCWLISFYDSLIFWKYIVSDNYVFCKKSFVFTRYALWKAGDFWGG